MAYDALSDDPASALSSGCMDHPLCSLREQAAGPPSNHRLFTRREEAGAAGTGMGRRNRGASADEESLGDMEAAGSTATAAHGEPPP